MKRHHASGAVPAVILVVGVLVTSACTHDPYSGFRDRGDPAKIATVRAVVPDLVDAENEVGRLVPGADGSLPAADNTSPAATERRRSELAHVAVPARAADELRAIDASVDELVASPQDAAMLGYTRAELELDRITGVAVDGDTATVVLRGTECYRALDGTKGCQSPSDFRLSLRATDDGTWLISDKTSQFLPGQGP